MSREIDERCARDVMGLSRFDYVVGKPVGPSFTIYTDAVYVTEDGTRESLRPWSPSEDPAAAMQVVERMRELGGVTITASKSGYVPLWSCTVMRDAPVFGAGTTFCQAVTTAALRAVGGEGGAE